MKILAIIAAMHVSAGNHAAGIQWCTCAVRPPVVTRLPDWHAVAPVPRVRVAAAWQIRAVTHIPLVRRR